MLMGILVVLLLLLLAIIVMLFTYSAQLVRAWEEVTGNSRAAQQEEKRTQTTRPALREKEKAQAEAQLADLLRNMGDTLHHMLRGNFSLAACLHAHIGMRVYVLPLPPTLNHHLLSASPLNANLTTHASANANANTNANTNDRMPLDCRLLDSRAESTLWRLFLESSVRCDSPLDAHFVFVPVMCACANDRRGPVASAALLEEAVRQTRSHLGDAYASRLLWPFTAPGGYGELAPQLSEGVRRFVEQGIHLTHRALRRTSSPLQWPDGARPPPASPDSELAPTVISVPPDLFGGLLQWQAFPGLLRMLHSGHSRSGGALRRRRAIGLDQPRNERVWMDSVLDMGEEDLVRERLIERLCTLPTEQHGLLPCGELADQLLGDRLLAESFVDQQLTEPPRTLSSPGLVDERSNSGEGGVRHVSARPFADQGAFVFGEWSLDMALMRELVGYWRDHRNSTHTAIGAILSQQTLTGVRQLADRFLDSVVTKRQSSVAARSSGAVAFVSSHEKDTFAAMPDAALTDTQQLPHYLRTRALLSMFASGRQFQLPESGIRCVESHGPFHRQMPLNSRELIRICEADSASAASAAAAMQSLFVLIPCDHPQNDLLYRVLGNNMIPLLMCDHWKLPFEDLVCFCFCFCIVLFIFEVRSDSTGAITFVW
jgi:hypothetical protein